MSCCRSLLVLAAVGMIAPASARAQDALRQPSTLTETAPAVFRARFETTKGAFVIEVHRDWAPHGADRFFNLVKNGFYDGTAVFRVRPGFMAQFGLHPDPEVQRAWQTAPLRDDPVVQKNVRGFVSFTTENRPQSRFTQVFVNYTDNTYLDEQGFAPFGQVVSGMEILEALHAYPREKEPDQRRILRDGNEYLKEFPDLDYVRRAVVE